MEFMRSQGVPIPRVFGQDLSASNEVGFEYIVIGRVPGRELSETWQSMTFKERMIIVEKIVDMDRVLFGVQFPASGSLYFAGFLGPHEKSVDIPDCAGGPSKFCVGPSTEYLWWYQNRHTLDVNRGPCEYSHPHRQIVADQGNYRAEQHGTIDNNR